MMGLVNDYSFEIDFLPVGDESKSGDAIAMRWGNDREGFYVAVVDGGTQESGERLVNHVKTVYGAQWINLAVNTHPDGDHSSGLAVVLEQFPVRALWMHRPWAYPQAIRHLFSNGNFTTQGLSGAIRRALDSAAELERIANRKGIPIVEPFQGKAFGPLLVLSPSTADYLKLIPHFNNTPDPKYQSPLAALASGGLRGAAGINPGGGLGIPRPTGNGLRGIGAISPGLGLAGLFANFGKHESWTNETLSDDGVTTEQNESSVVLYGRFNGTGVLLTGDAGQAGLWSACAYALANGIDLRTCAYYQVPHHGSRRNVSPVLLDHILGPKHPNPVQPTRWAVASVATQSTDHPRKAVVNAFRRRGVGVHVTKGTTTQFSRGYPARTGWVAASVLPLYNMVDD